MCRPKRTLHDVSVDNLYPPSPFGGLSDPDPEREGTRYQAIAHILTTMPDESYEKLKGMSSAFIWYIPDRDLFGQIYPVPTAGMTVQHSEHLSFEYTPILYLSPLLEKTAWDIVLASVGHELAHLILAHKLLAFDEEEERKQEEEADNLVCRWGYEKQIKKHRATARMLWTKQQRKMEAFQEGSSERLTPPRFTCQQVSSDVVRRRHIGH